MPQETLTQLERLVSICSQVAFVGKDADLDDDVVVQNILSLNRELVTLTGVLRAYQRYANSLKA